MSEIDVSRCDYYFQGRCGVSKNINYSIDCYANGCYYKQLQKLKQENEELKKGVMLECPQCGETYLNKIGCDLYEEKQKYKQCIDEIEGIVNYGSVSYNNHKELADFYEDKIEEIIKLIKQAKEGK